MLPDRTNPACTIRFTECARLRGYALGRAVLLLFVLCAHLGYGFTVLADVHGIESCDLALVSPAVGTGDAHGEVECDHCCHAAAHLVGISPDNFSVKSPPRSNPSRASIAGAWESRSLPPPVRPPKQSV